MNESGTDACAPVSRGWAGSAWNYIWLAYSGFYFIDPIVRRNTGYWIETACVYVLFLAIYFGINRVFTRRAQLGLIAAMFLLGVIDYPRNQGASSFLIYAGGYLPFYMASVPWTVGLIAVDFAVLIAEGVWLIRHPGGSAVEPNPFNLAISSAFVLVVGASNLVVARQKRANEKLWQAEREIVQLAAVADRERIARDLHDVLGHTLSVIVLKAELAGRLVERDPARAWAEIGEVEQTARTALAEVREAIGGYRARGLAAEMVAARRALGAAGVALTLEEAESMAVLDAEVQTVLSLTLREAVTNIVRHAGATQCRVSLTRRDGVCGLAIEDDGTHTAPREGNGLRGMRERVERFGGRFWLETQRGTTVRVEIPAVGASA